MKLFCTNIQDFELEHIERRFPTLAASGAFSAEPLSAKSVLHVPSDVEVLIISHTCTGSAEVLTHLPKLSAVITRSTGTDHIDKAFCELKGIVVENIPDYSTESVAEYSIALLLILLRNIHAHLASKSITKRFLCSGVELRGKRVGIVGLGKVGRTIARLVAGFGAQVMFVGTGKRDAGLLRASQASSLEELYALSDVLFFCCPLTPATKHMLNSGNIRKLKHGVVVINTSRGGVLETSALIAGLKDGHIGGAALDVLEEEADVLSDTTHALWKELLAHPRVLYTPHNAFLSAESLERMWDKVFDLASFVEVQADAGRIQVV